MVVEIREPNESYAKAAKESGGFEVALEMPGMNHIPTFMELGIQVSLENVGLISSPTFVNLPTQYPSKVKNNENEDVEEIVENSDAAVEKEGEVDVQKEVDVGEGEVVGQEGNADVVDEISNQEADESSNGWWGTFQYIGEVCASMCAPTMMMDMEDDVPSHPEPIPEVSVPEPEPEPEVMYPSGPIALITFPPFKRYSNSPANAS